MAVLGQDLLSYYTAEFLIAQYPRLPLAVVFAAMYAYVGPKALAAITREWGVDYAAHPGGEVDPGLLQFKRLPPEPVPEKPLKAGPDALIKTRGDAMLERPLGWRASISARAVYQDEFGSQKPITASKHNHKIADDPDPEVETGVTAEKACTSFIRALMAAIHLHGGRAAAKSFYRSHFMSRQLNMSQLFQFRFPSRDLSRLCAREGFQSPVARIISETGRKSRHPVFIVGVFSGNDKLGEGAGASLDEARTRAAVAALKGWYLYSPLEFRMPSEMEEEGAMEWRPALVDQGDIVSF
jgi:dsRNA-specific ribonuclease